jgi:hypothetical protein
VSKLIAVLAGLLFVVSAYAEPVAKLANQNGGHMYLTLDPCDLKLEVPVSDPLFRVYAVDFEGTPNERTVEACWFSPRIDFSQVPENQRRQVVRVVNILAPDGIYSYPVTDFEPIQRVTKGEF